MSRVKSRLNAHHIKPTSARCAIVEVLESASSPLSYEQIKVQMDLVMDKATFYRNMALFEESALVSKFESDDRKWYYELGKMEHAHFICESCHEISCMDIPVPSQAQGNKVKSVILKGTCKTCY